MPSRRSELLVRARLEGGGLSSIPRLLKCAWWSVGILSCLRFLFFLAFFFFLDLRFDPDDNFCSGAVNLHLRLLLTLTTSAPGSFCLKENHLSEQFINKFLVIRNKMNWFCFLFQKYYSKVYQWIIDNMENLSEVYLKSYCFDTSKRWFVVLFLLRFLRLSVESSTIYENQTFFILYSGKNDFWILTNPWLRTFLPHRCQSFASDRSDLLGLTIYRKDLAIKI